MGAWELGITYFDGTILHFQNDLRISMVSSGELEFEWEQVRGLFYELQKSTDLINYFPVGAREQATEDQKAVIVPWDLDDAYYRVLQTP